MNPYQGFNRPPVDILPAPSGSVPSVASNDDSPRRKRTRAKRSCDMCRKKKSKCDAEVNRPCTNCKNWKTECVFLVEQKKRGPSTGHRMESLIENLAKANGAPDEPSNDEPSIHSSDEITPPPSTDEASTTSIGDPGEAFVDRMESISESPQPDSPDHSIKVEAQMQGLQIQDYGSVCYMGSSSGIDLINRHFLKGKKMRVPGEKLTFVQKVNDDEAENVIVKTEVYTPEDLILGCSQSTPSSSTVHDDDENLLYDKTLTDRLVELFFENIYIHAPFINKAQFLHAYNIPECTGSRDEYLLAAICGIGARFLPEDIVYATPRQDGSGFDIVRRKSSDIVKFFEHKANTVVDIAFKRSRISTLQTLLLITMYFEHSHDIEETSARWFIAGVAIRMAQDLGLHLSPTRWNIPKHEIELRRRLWYSTYLMDRWVSAELGRPVTLLDHDFDVELPTEYELELPPSLSGAPCSGEATPEADDHNANRKPKFKGFIHMIRLTQILGQVLQNLHTPRARAVGRRNESLVRFLDGALVRWKLNLSPELEFNTSIQACSTRGYIQMCYNLVLLLLHRPASTDRIEKSDTAFQSLTICTNAAHNILSIAENLTPEDFTQSPWSITMYTIVQASLIFLHLSKGDNIQLKQCGFNSLLRCVRLFKRTEFRCSAPDKLVNFLFALVAMALDRNEVVTHLLTAQDDDEVARSFAAEVDEMTITPTVGLSDLNIGKEKVKRAASVSQHGQNKRPRAKDWNDNLLMGMLDASETADSHLIDPPNDFNPSLQMSTLQSQQQLSPSGNSTRGYNQPTVAMTPNESQLLCGTELDTSDSFALMEGLLSINSPTARTQVPSNATATYNPDANNVQMQLPNFAYMSELHAPEPDSEQPQDIIQQLFQNPRIQGAQGDGSNDPSLSLLNSEIAIWEAPSSMIWNDWDQYVTSLTSAQ
ncbi:fungal-specific transcription factor domain-containing protein [Umbelopsis sp. AD052]|nr:fungal-specific transcription factor domain-containing protein [Umbelopsis sp. AD052]